MTKHIVVCADDYGQTLPISQAILALVKAKRLTAVSCMVTGDDWPLHATWLKPLLPHIHVGLHFNLTHGHALSPMYKTAYGQTFPRLYQLLIKSHLRLLKKAPIQAEFTAQWQRFTEEIGKEPDFIDGHQHIHQFPIIRDAIIEAVQTHSHERLFIRLVNPSGWFNGGLLPKTAIIKLSGTMGLKRLLTKYNIPFNTSFTGIYSFSDSLHYQKHMRNFLNEINDQGLLMCHPGFTNPSEEWPLSASRPHEYAYLSSAAFLEDLQLAGVALTPFCYLPKT